ncbi:hypothetical protein D9757_015012 [Collybiopsis confluens]|uniref:Uncharacterized protein n=1 Tax=Collybiopsis confluens TaxID=2823264 RepID=A0A8H5FJD7_9AGAR|nr:hypothetical protein D9757_015012 [Collybiopsis confluens]
MGILSNAPVDIARLILEYAAQADKATAASLCLVSKEVNSWATPILYRTMELSKRAHIEMAERGYASLKHTQTLLFRDTQIVLENGLYVFMVADPDLLVRSCSDLREIHISEKTVRGIHGYTVFDKLTRLIVHGHTFLRPGEFVFIPVYPSLTHLAFIHDIPRNFAKDAADVLPNLTHFACSYRVRGLKSETPTLETSGMLANQLSLLLDNVLRVPLLRVIVVVVQDFAEDHAGTTPTDNEREAYIHRLLKRVPQRNNNKVVCFYLTSQENKQSVDSMPNSEIWDVTSKRSFWARAEKVVMSRVN